MLAVDDGCFEDPGLVRFETAADHGDEARIVAKTGRGAVDREEAIATLDKRIQCRELLRRDLGVVRVEQEGVVVAEGIRGEAIRLGEVLGSKSPPVPSRS